MTNLIHATYFASYDDHEGCDEVPCIVDTNKMEVISFGQAIKCRWYEDAVLMCEEESIVLADGRDFDAIKFDEYDDAVYGGYEDEYNRENIILFDADKLADACQSFGDAARADAADGFNFYTCEVKGAPTKVSNTSTVSEDIHDATEHIRRGIRTMKRNIERVEGYNEKWPNFYDDYLAKAAEMLEVLEAHHAEIAALETEIRLMG